jgi:hypothetical protein
MYTVIKTMLLDCKNRKYQIIGNDGRAYSSHWKEYDELSDTILDIVIKPESRELFKSKSIELINK